MDPPTRGYLLATQWRLIGGCCLLFVALDLIERLQSGSGGHHVWLLWPATTGWLWLDYRRLGVRVERYFWWLSPLIPFGLYGYLIHTYRWRAPGFILLLWGIVMATLSVPPWILDAAGVRTPDAMRTYIPDMGGFSGP